MSWSAKAGLAVFAAVGVFVWLLGPILMPFVVSAGLAYLGDPVVDRLQRYRISRTGAVIIVFLVMTAISLPVMALLLPMLVEQVRVFVAHIPDYLDWIQNRGLPAIGITLPDQLRLDADNLKRVVAENLPQAGGFARTILGVVTTSGVKLLGFFAGLLLIPVVTFYLLRDWDRLVAWIDDAIPTRHRELARALATECDLVLAGFLRGQLLVMLSLSIIYTMGLALIGVNLALLIGIGAGLVSFVPYLGFIAGIFAASIAVLVQFQELTPLAWVFLVFLIGQVVESMILTPWLVGDRIGLHPVAVVFAVMAGGQLFGFVGVLIGLPVAAVVAVGLRHAMARWRASQAYLQP